MRTLATELLYLVDTGARPVTLATEAGEGASERSGTYRLHRTPIRDARRLDPEPTLDREGFTLRVHTTCVLDLHHDPSTPAGAAPRESIEVRAMAFW